MGNQSGFTLIELVVVIVLLGILAATAVPKYMDLQDEAAQAAVEGVAGALASASALNYGNFMVKGTGEDVLACDDLFNLVNEDLNTDYDLDATAFTSPSNGQVQSCTLTHTKSTKTAIVSAIVVDVP